MHPVLSTILKRLGLGIFTLFMVSICDLQFDFDASGRFYPSSFGTVGNYRNGSSISKRIRVDRPAPIRYAEWVVSVLKGDLGTSFSGRSASGVDRSRPVVSLVAPRLWNTLFLAMVTALVAVPLSLILGITAALYQFAL